MRTLKTVGLGLAVFLCTNACVPHVDEQHVENVRPSTADSVRKSAERRDVEPTIKSDVKGDVVTVTLEQPTECQEKIQSPIVTETGTERSLRSGTLAQGLNVVSAGLLIAGGIALYSSAGSGSCTKTPEPTAQNQNPASRPCTADEAEKEKSTAKGWGIGLTSLSVLPIGAFVWNIFRAQDDKKTTSTVKETTSGWTACGARPLEGIHLSLTLAPSTSGGSETKLAATTDGQGRATFDLSHSRSMSDQAGLLALLPKGEQTTYVALRGTPMRIATDSETKDAATAKKKDAARAIALGLLQEVEQGAARLQNTKWPDVDIVTFAQLLTRMKAIPETLSGADVELSEAERLRFRSIAPRMEKLMPGFQKAQTAYVARLDAAQARQDQVYLANGWDGIRKQLVAPSTASLVGTKILLRCNHGRIIHYEFDSQNRMGALLRGRGIVKINDTGFNARIEGELVGDMSPYEILLRAAAKGDCSELE